MMNTRPELDYRLATTEGANSIGLTIALYDTLARDLQKIAAAIQDNDIQSRCKETQHALLVLGYLESWVNPAASDALSCSLVEFYRYVRSQIVLAQSSGTQASVARTAMLVLETRAVWQQQEERLAKREASATEKPSDRGFAAAALANPSEVRGSWSA